jgi:hypothetical protein
VIVADCLRSLVDEDNDNLSRSPEMADLFKHCAKHLVQPIVTFVEAIAVRGMNECVALLSYFLTFPSRPFSFLLSFGPCLLVSLLENGASAIEGEEASQPRHQCQHDWALVRLECCRHGWPVQRKQGAFLTISNGLMFFAHSISWRVCKSFWRRTAKTSTRRTSLQMTRVAAAEGRGRITSRAGRAIHSFPLLLSWIALSFFFFFYLFLDSFRSRASLRNFHVKNQLHGTHAGEGSEDAMDTPSSMRRKAPFTMYAPSLAFPVVVAVVVAVAAAAVVVVVVVVDVVVVVVCGGGVFFAVSLCCCFSPRFTV